MAAHPVSRGGLLRVAGLGVWLGVLAAAWAGCGDDAAAVCGNGAVEKGEACDSGGRLGLCTPDCGWAARTIDTDGTASLPSVAVTEGGCIVVGYQVVAEGSLVPKVHAVVYDGGGALVWGPKPLAPDQSEAQGRVQVVGLSGCGFAAVWEDGPEMHRGVYGRIFPDGSWDAAPPRVQLNSDLHADRYEPVAAVSGEGFLVAWTALYYDGDDASVAARLFDGDLAATEPEFVVNTYTTGPQERPAVACGTERCIVVWQSKCQEFG